MQGTSVLEFMLMGDIYCLNAEVVEYVFELESYNELHGLHRSVLGVTKYNDDIIILIDTINLYSGKSNDLVGEKNVIVVQKNKHLFGMIVDQIVKIEELQKAKASVDLNSQELVVNHYKEGDKLVNEIEPFTLLEKFHIPALMQNEEKRVLPIDVINAEHGDYLLFKVAKKLYAIEALHVNEVLENSVNKFFVTQDDQKVGAVGVRDEVISLLDFEEALKGDDLLIINAGERKVALEIDEVLDIEVFESEKIELVEGVKYISGFYNFKEKVVAILDPKLFRLQNSNKKDKTAEKQTKQQTLSKKDFLLFYINEQQYGVDMTVVRQVSENSSLSKTDSSAISSKEYIEFITTFAHHGVNVINIATLLGDKSQNSSDDMQSIFIEKEGHFVAFIVDDVENIVYLNQEEISYTDTKDTIIGGAIIVKNSIVPLVNTDYILSLG